MREAAGKKIILISVGLGARQWGVTFGGLEEVGRVGSDHLCELSKSQVLITCGKKLHSVKEHEHRTINMKI